MYQSSAISVLINVKHLDYSQELSGAHYKKKKKENKASNLYCRDAVGTKDDSPGSCSEFLHLWNNHVFYCRK